MTGTTREKELPGGPERAFVRLGVYQAAVDSALLGLKEGRIADRIWARDYTVWGPDPAEIANRLGWLEAPNKMLAQLDCLAVLVEDVRAAGYTDVLLLGMGGSSLAPEVFSRVAALEGQIARSHAGLHLEVLDSTDPAAVRHHAERLDPARTLFIVSTKSGNTVETLSLFRFFYNWAADALGIENAGQHFMAITDPGSRLAEIAQEHDFRTTFLNDPHIGGRYSALSYFGLVPAALVGWDLEALLNRAVAMACDCAAADYTIEAINGGLVIGAILAELARAGRDKMTLLLSPSVASLGDWIEQLVAESTGKKGRGILPVVGEPVGPPAVYGDDRFFVYLRLDDEVESGPAENAVLDRAVQVLEKAGHPIVRLDLGDVYDLGKQFFLWEMVTAVASHRLGINPFDQPNVEAAKVLARQMMDRYRQAGVLPEGESVPPSAETLRTFLAAARPHDYIALQAYVQPTPETDVTLGALRERLRERYRLATTTGYGPRFLHSTGQLHKGDAGSGLFIQFISDAVHDVPISDETGVAGSSVTFGLLEAAQALGDWQALRDAGRRVIRVRLRGDVASEIDRLARSL
jgi:transaldolase/glucose-6-phosphate isomerase